MNASRARGEAALDAVLDVGFFLLLIVSGLRYFAFHPLAGEGMVILALAVGVGAAYALSLGGRRATGANRAPAGGLASGGVLVSASLWMPLAVLAPSFGWCAVALILRLRPVLRSRLAWAFPAVMILAESVGIALMTGGQDPGLVLGVLFAGSVLTWAVAALDGSLRRRAALIAQLRAARVRLAEAERAAGAGAERERLAGELHDTVVQRSAGALMLLETTILTEPDASPLTLQARDALREALRQARAMLDQTPVPDDVGEGGGLADRLRAEAAAAGTTLTVEAHEAHDGRADPAGRRVMEASQRVLTAAGEHALLRAAQEGLANAAKHAGGPLDPVLLRWGPDEVSVEVRDRGVGFDPGSVARGGFGLRAMRARLGQAGGTLRVLSAPGEGTTLVASVPLPVPAAQPTTTPTLEGDA